MDEQAIEELEKAAHGSETGDSDRQTVPCVVVTRHLQDDPNKVAIEIAEFNGMDPFSVPTLLRAAADIREAQLRPNRSSS